MYRYSTVPYRNTLRGSGPGAGFFFPYSTSRPWRQPCLTMSRPLAAYTLTQAERARTRPDRTRPACASYRSARRVMRRGQRQSRDAKSARPDTAHQIWARCEREAAEAPLALAEEAPHTERLTRPSFVATHNTSSAELGRARLCPLSAAF